MLNQVDVESLVPGTYECPQPTRVGGRVDCHLGEVLIHKAGVALNGDVPRLFRPREERLWPDTRGRRSHILEQNSSVSVDAPAKLPERVSLPLVQVDVVRCRIGRIGRWADHTCVVEKRQVVNAILVVKLKR